MALTKLTGSSIQNDAIGATQLDETDNYTFTGTIVGAGGNMSPSFGANPAGNYSLSSSGVWTLIAFDSEVMDNGNCYDTSAGQYKFTPGVSGNYHVFSMVNWYAGNGNVTSMNMAIYKNGSEYQTFRDTSFQSNQSQYYIGSSTYSGIINLNTTDYLQVYWNSTYSSTAPALNKTVGGSTFGAYKIIT